MINIYGLEIKYYNETKIGFSISGYINPDCGIDELPESHLELLDMVLDELSFEDYELSQIIEGLEAVRDNKGGIYIDDTFHPWDEVKEIIEKYLVYLN
jgi:hypothetical protein